MRRVPPPPVPTPRPFWRWWILLALLVLGGLGAIAYYMIVVRAQSALRALANAGQVQSLVSPWGDSLQVIVSWEFTTPPRQRADSLRVEVQIDSLRTVATRVRLHSGRRRQDTVYVPAPPPGTSAE